MGIYILKEFPKNCNDCPCTSGWNCFADDEMRDIAEYDDNHTKPDWCPLVEVPTPHGRLIDADAYHKEIRERYESAREWYKGAKTDDIKSRAESALFTFTECSLTLRKMPTIIKTEGKDADEEEKN